MMFDSVIERLNLWGDQISRIAWPLLWQSSLLIAGMFLLDFFLRRRLRPSVRHALWLVVLVKLLLPPSLAFPSGLGWWLRPREAAPTKPPVASYVVTYGPSRAAASVPAVSYVPAPARRIRLSTAGCAVLGTAGIGVTLFIVMLDRWRRLRHKLSECQSAPIWLQEIACDAQRTVYPRTPARLVLTDASISPALCGLFRPVIVLPTVLVKQLTPAQLRAVILHELLHLRNGHVWINCFQSLLQIIFWWHPLLWFANARIRRVREEVVDDAVRLALGGEAENYAPALLEVARLALVRPLATLGLVGILESRHALKQRVDRLVNYPAPRRAGLSIISSLAIITFASVALPMGQAPPKSVKSVQTSDSKTAVTENVKAAESAKLGWDIHPITDNGWIDYNLESGIASTTNGAVVKYGDTTITADNITLNQQTGEVLASGLVKVQSGASDPSWELRSGGNNRRIEYNVATGIGTATNGAVFIQGDKVVRADDITFDRKASEVVVYGHYNTKSASADATNMQLAQNQPSVINPSRVIQTSSGRKRIMSKLEAIRLNHVTFDNLPLSEVVNYLQDEAKKRDPEGKGINFILNPNADLAGPPAVDPATGLQVEPADINGVAIRISPPLEDVRMIDVLDAITKVAGKRIRYSIEDYGISFRLAGNGTPVPLFTRVIKVDPNVFAQGLESVVGFSVGNFQTGGQGGGGQQGNSSGVTIPRVQVAPNIGGQGAQGGQGGAQGGVGGISGVTRPTATISPQAFRQFFANAGVDLTPPKSAYLNFTEGSLLVHATLNDLDIIEQAVGALSTSAARPKTASIIETPSKRVLPQTNVTKAPILGDSPIAGKALTRTVEVSAANSPQQITNAATAGAGEKLVTRIIKVDPNTFGESVKKTAGLLDNSSSQETLDAFRKLLLGSGVELRPPANMFYSKRNGSLFVRATPQEMEAIEQKVQQFNVSPPQINIQARFVEISGDLDADALAKDFGTQSGSNMPAGEPLAGNGDTNRSLIAVLGDPQFRVILHALEQRDGVDVVSEQNVTTLSGRQAQVQTSDVQSIVKLNPQALVSPGVASSNVYVTESVYSGPVLDIIPYVSEDGDKIQLTIIAKVTEFVGYDAPESGEAVPVFLDGQATTIKPPHPRTHVRTMQTAAVNVYDGQTVVLGRPKDEMITLDKDGKVISAPSTSKKILLVFVTATLIDPAGNPVHSAGSSASSPQSH